MQQGATTLAVKAKVPVRTCTKCRRRKEVGVDIKPRGRVCAQCQRKLANLRNKKYYSKWGAEAREKNNEGNRRWRKKNPEASYAATVRWRKKNAEKVRLFSQKYRERLLADPVKHEEHLENKRINEKLRLERNGGKIRVVSEERYRQGNGKITRAEVLPAQPLIDVLVPLNLTYLEIALRCGVDEALIRRIMEGQEAYKPLVTIDKICVGMGLTLSLVYDLDIAVGRGATLDVAL